MPIYEYQCQACEHEFEELVQASAADDARCPKCDSAKVGRKMSVFSAQQATPDLAAPMGGGPCGQCDSPGGSCPFSQ